MKTTLPILAALVAVAAGIGWANRGQEKVNEETPAGRVLLSPGGRGAIVVPASSGGEVAYPDADALLREAVAQLGRVPTLEAKVRQKIALFGRELIGAGVYAQQGGGVTTKLRLEMRIRSGEQSTDLLQVCDGEMLWTFNAADGQRILRRVDVDRIVDHVLAAEEKRTGQPPSAASERGIGLGGIPWMLDGLRQSCRFDTVRSERLGQLEVLAVEGTWRDEKLFALLPEADRKRIAPGATIDREKLPPHLPDRVVVYLGRDDLFPYRFDYLRRPREGDDAPAHDSSGAATMGRLVMSLEFYEVRQGHALPARLFDYTPGQGAIDDTERYLGRL